MRPGWICLNSNDNPGTCARFVYFRILGLSVDESIGCASVALLHELDANAPLCVKEWVSNSSFFSWTAEHILHKAAVSSLPLSDLTFPCLL